MRRFGLLAMAFLATGFVSCPEDEPASVGSSTSSTSTTVFQSGFEPDSTVTHETIGGRWVSDVIGLDTATGYDWTNDLPGDGAFYYFVRSDRELAGYVNTRIDEVTGPEGRITKALYQEVRREDEAVEFITRNQFDLFPRAGEDFTKGYIRYWLKFQPNMSQLYTCEGCNWRNLMEWREENNIYRIVVNLIREGEPFFWRTSGESTTQLRTGMERRGAWYVDWEVENHDIAVPVDQWFLVEIYFERDTSTGIVRVKIDGQPIANYEGRTMVGRLRSWQIFKVYTSEEVFAVGPAYQWIDSVYLCVGDRCSEEG